MDFASVIKAVAPHRGGPAATRQIKILAALVANADAVNALMLKYEVNTVLRLAHFVGQTMEESDGYCTLREYGSGHEYEGRHDLGNVHAGDGSRYLGRSPLQLTGWANYYRVGKELNVPLADHPEMAEQIPLAIEISLVYWRDHRLNALADTDDIEHVTRVVNGGWNGLGTRVHYTMLAKEAQGLKPPFHYQFSPRALQALRNGH